MEKIKEKLSKSIVTKVFLINLIIFVICNLLFDIKYEQVDDFIIYNLYSGLDGTYNIHGVYIHPVICFIIGLFFRVLPFINWHTIFLLLCQLICFTIIGTILLKKNTNRVSYLLYTLFASVFYTVLLQLIQYTSVSALLILTAFFIIIDMTQRNTTNRKCTILYIILFTLGIMLRMQSLLIVVPFLALYLVYYLILKVKENKTKQECIELLKKYIVLGMITIVIYLSNLLIYQTDNLYEEYMEYNDMRATLHDVSYTPYEENKEIFDEIGWSKNDHYLFYSFNFGDENVYSKENLQKIIEYKKANNEYYNLNLDIKEVEKTLIQELKNDYTYIGILFIVSFFIALYTNREKTGFIISIFILTVLVHTLFIVLNRTMLRVVIPEYILGTAMMLYFIKYKEEKNKIDNRLKAISIITILVTIVYVGGAYQYNYYLEDYNNYKNVINYTNEHKENVYLYTVPSLQYRYLAYSVYEMPPKASFTNLRVMGGWDMFTQNYEDFKERYNLDGTFLDLLKEDVYLIDGDVNWSGNYYHNYIDNIVLFIKENYGKNVNYKKVEIIGNIYIYKIYEE